MNTGWKTHKGVKYIYNNYSGFDTDLEALTKEVTRAEDMICRAPEKSVLALTDVRRTVTTRIIVNLFKKSAMRTEKYIAKHAVIGVSGIQKIIADAVMRVSGQSLTLFDNIDDAKDWLVE